MMRYAAGVVLLSLSCGIAHAAPPLTCTEAIRAFDDARAKLSIAPEVPFGPDVFGEWTEDNESFRFNPAGTTGVEVTVDCAADGLFNGLKSLAIWEGEKPDISEWTAAQLPVDVMAVAITGELGPDLTDMAEEALTEVSPAHPDGQAIRRVDDVFDAKVEFGRDGNLSRLTFTIARSDR